MLMGHGWPGNIRELENVVERAIILARENLISPAELPVSITSARDLSSREEPGHTLSIKKASRRLERDLIRKALDLTGGNRSRAAKILEISRPILISKIKEYGLEG
jgi:two-component system response regulator AtoC